MIEYIFAIIIIVLLVFITITANYVFILTEKQIKELWIGTILMIILLGYLRSKFLELYPIDKYLFVPTGLYVIWYILTKITSNLINKDSDANIIRDTSF